MTQLSATLQTWSVFLSDGYERKDEHTHRQVSKGQADYQGIGGRTELLVNNNCYYDKTVP